MPLGSLFKPMAEIPPEYVSQGGYLVRIEDRQKMPELRAQSVPGAGKYRFPQFIFRQPSCRDLLFRRLASQIVGVPCCSD